MYSLAPLSGGGYVYNYPLLPHTQPALATQGQPPVSPSFVPIEAAPPVGIPPPGFAPFTREEKLERYRQKRLKRNFNRPVDTARSERALARARDPSGQFAFEKPSQKKMKECLDLMKNKLAVTQRESEDLQSKLRSVEKELAMLRQKAEDADMTKARMLVELEQQQTINNQLTQLLWSSVPSAEVFSTIRPGAPFAEAFKETVDLSMIELNETDSPFLENQIVPVEPEPSYPLFEFSDLSARV